MGDKPLLGQVALGPILGPAEQGNLGRCLGRGLLVWAGGGEPRCLDRDLELHRVMAAGGRLPPAPSPGSGLPLRVPGE